MLRRVAEHFCPMCGVAHGADEEVVEPEVVVEEAPIEQSESTGDVAEVATAAVDAVARVAESGFEALAVVQLAEEETERVEAAADVAEAAADALAEQVVADEPEDEPEEEPDDEQEPEPESVTVPPQDEPERPDVERSRTVSAFRRHRR